MKSDQPLANLSADILNQGEFQWGKVSLTGIELHDNTPETEWRRITEQVASLFEATGKKHAQCAMMLGDLLRWGEERFGETYADVIDATREYMRVQVKTLINWTWIAGKIEASRRRENLTLAHHEAVAKLEPNEQDEFLKLADDEGLSVKELKEKIRERHPGKPRNEKDSTAVQKFKITDAKSAKDGATQLSNWLTENEEKIPESLKPVLEHIYKLYRRRWMSGHKR